MNKALHVLVYVFLALAAAALFFELQLRDKRAELTDRNKMQEDYIVKIAKVIEKEDAPEMPPVEVKKDISPVEARELDNPEMSNLLEDYKAQLEKDNLPTFDWEGYRDQLRQVYVIDPETNKPVLDGSEPQQRDSPEDKLLATLLDAAKAQLARLNTTRAELASLHSKLETTVSELNALKQEARRDKTTIVEKQEKIEKLEGEKAELENQVTRLRGEIDGLNTEIASLKDEVVTAKEETEVVRDELEKTKKVVEQLKKLLQRQINQHNDNTGKGAALTSLSAGDKGTIVQADNTFMFAIVKLSAETAAELNGKEIVGLEMGVKRAGFNGAAGEFVGRVRIRQEVKGKPYVICDILDSWKQDTLQPNDTVFAD